MPLLIPVEFEEVVVEVAADSSASLPPEVPLFTVLVGLLSRIVFGFSRILTKSTRIPGRPNRGACCKVFAPEFSHFIDWSLLVLDMRWVLCRWYHFHW